MPRQENKSLQQLLEKKNCRMKSQVISSVGTLNAIGGNCNALLNNGCQKSTEVHQIVG